MNISPKPIFTNQYSKPKTKNLEQPRCSKQKKVQFSTKFTTKISKNEEKKHLSETNH